MYAVCSRKLDNCSVRYQTEAKDSREHKMKVRAPYIWESGTVTIHLSLSVYLSGSEAIRCINMDVRYSE